MIPDTIFTRQPYALHRANCFLRNIGATRKLKRDPHGYYCWLEMDGRPCANNGKSDVAPKPIYISRISDLTYFQIREDYEFEFGELPLTK